MSTFLSPPPNTRPRYTGIRKIAMHRFRCDRRGRSVKPKGRLYRENNKKKITAGTSHWRGALRRRLQHGAGPGTLVRIRASDASGTDRVEMHARVPEVPKMSGSETRIRGPPWRGLRTGRRVEAGRGFGRAHWRRLGKGPRTIRDVAHGLLPDRFVHDQSAAAECTCALSSPLSRGFTKNMIFLFFFFFHYKTKFYVTAVATITTCLMRPRSVRGGFLLVLPWNNDLFCCVRRCTANADNSSAKNYFYYLIKKKKSAKFELDRSLEKGTRATFKIV